MAKLKLPDLEKLPAVAGFLEGIERDRLEEDIVECLTVKIPRLWRMEFSDADPDDMPAGLRRLIEELAAECNVDFDLDEDDLPAPTYPPDDPN